MAAQEEQAATDVGEKVDEKNDSKLDVSKVGDSDSSEPEKPVPVMSEDEYPRGIALVLLSASALVAVFLIALDQVSTSGAP